MKLSLRIALLCLLVGLLYTQLFLLPFGGSAGAEPTGSIDPADAAPPNRGPSTRAGSGAVTSAAPPFTAASNHGRANGWANRLTALPAFGTALPAADLSLFASAAEVQDDPSTGASESNPTSGGLELPSETSTPGSFAWPPPGGWDAFVSVGSRSRVWVDDSVVEPSQPPATFVPVPEPSTYAAGATILLAGVLALRRWRGSKQVR